MLPLLVSEAAEAAEAVAHAACIEQRSRHRRVVFA